MKTWTKILVLMGALTGLSAAPSLAPADVDPVNGAWNVKGKVEGYPVKVRCEFERRGDQLGGLCRDGDAEGAAHALSGSAVQGDHVSWTYHRRFLFRNYEAQYAGVVNGATMTGTISVAGHTGAFTAARE